MSDSNKPKMMGLSAEQVTFVINKMSSDEQQQMRDLVSKCQGEIMMTRALPFSAIVLGSLYYARQRLPEKHHFGPKGWPFYAIMGVSAFVAGNVLFIGTCRERIQPFVQELWRKYGSDPAVQSMTNYEEIRRRHRAGEAPQYAQQQQAQSERPGYGMGPRRPYRDSTRDPAPVDTFGTELEPPQKPDFHSFRYPEQGGAPVGQPLGEPVKPQFPSYNLQETPPQEGFIYDSTGGGGDFSSGQTSSSDYGPMSGGSRKRSTPPPYYGYSPNDPPSYMSGTPQDNGPTSMYGGEKPERTF